MDLEYQAQDGKQLTPKESFRSVAFQFHGMKSKSKSSKKVEHQLEEFKTDLFEYYHNKSSITTSSLLAFIFSRISLLLENHSTDNSKKSFIRTIIYNLLDVDNENVDIFRKVAYLLYPFLSQKSNDIHETDAFVKLKGILFSIYSKRSDEPIAFRDYVNILIDQFKFQVKKFSANIPDCASFAQPR